MNDDVDRLAKDDMKRSKNPAKAAESYTPTSDALARDEISRPLVYSRSFAVYAFFTGVTLFSILINSFPWIGIEVHLAIQQTLTHYWSWMTLAMIVLMLEYSFKSTSGLVGRLVTGIRAKLTHSE